LTDYTFHTNAFAIVLLVAIFIRVAYAFLLWFTRMINPTPNRIPGMVELKKKGDWLQREMESGQFYLDPEISLHSLADKLSIHPHELSRIINTGLGKNFNDFINGYRTREVMRKMEDRAYDKMTLLGIGMDCGFNSKATFIRSFKLVTGKNPGEYKQDLKKQGPTYHLQPPPGFTELVLCHKDDPLLSLAQVNRIDMFSNYLKIAWRNLLSSKVYSGLNIVGLAAGMAVALMIGLWVVNEYSYDHFLTGYKNLYQVKRNFSSNGEIGTVTSSSLALADKLRSEIPEIQDVAETDYFNAHGLMTGEKKLYMNGGQVGSDFLKMFRYPFLEGGATDALKNPFSIVLTEATAKALFNSTDVLGKTVRIDNLNDLKVTGVLKDIPFNSSLQFQYLIPFSYYEIADSSVKAGRSTGFNQNAFQVFVELKPGISYAQVQPKIRGLEKKYLPGANTEISMQPLEDWHLYSDYKNGKAAGGYIDYVRIFSIIGALVLMIAGINFVNLTTARSEGRAKEVGVRKTMGSSRRDLIFQFLTESVLAALISFFVCLFLTWISIPYFNLLIKGHLEIPFSSIAFWGGMLTAACIIGLLAGSKPAFYLSAFNPVKVLKGMKTGRTSSFSRQALVVIQFSCSIALIISTLIIYQQVNYAKNRPIGYDLSLLMQTNQNRDLGSHYEALKKDLLASGFVQDVARASSPATGIFWHSGISWPGQLPGETINIGTVKVSSGYFKTMGMELSQGRDFTGDNASDSLDVIINDAAAKRLRLAEPLNQIITWNNNKLRIIGIAKNALVESPYTAAEPTMYMSGGGNFLLYRLIPSVAISPAIERLTTIFNGYDPAYPYSYQFADQRYAAKFALELLIGKLAGIFAGLAIFISCLGLFGLATYIAERRSREVSIRKVLGASVIQLWAMLSKDFLLLVTISCLVASPVAYYFLHDWLQKYYYRITIGRGVFLLAGLMAIIVTLLTISYQAIRAALTNPVKNLRSE
jgi:putative ABC transport system permease protein